MTNILIVDDEEKICEFIKAFLDNEGYYADVAYDGKSAIDKINSKKYDLIILDRMLPYVSGEEICKYIRSKSQVPIIMLTAKIEDEEQIKDEKFSERLKKELRKVTNEQQLERKKEEERLEELKVNKIPFCPKCHSTSIHYIEKRKRFSLGRTIVGGAVGSLVNPIGTAVGAAMGGLTSNKQKKGEVKCLNCGYKWKL